MNGKETPRRYQAIVVDDYPSTNNYWAQADATNCTKDATMSHDAYELAVQAYSPEDVCRALPAPDLDPGDHDVEFTLEHDAFTSGAVPLRITEPNLTLALNDATLNTPRESRRRSGTANRNGGEGGCTCEIKDCGDEDEPSAAAAP